MKPRKTGTVADYAEGSGIIETDDGMEYRFDWADIYPSQKARKKCVVIGTRVTFVIAKGGARGVQPAPVEMLDHGVVVSPRGVEALGGRPSKTNVFLRAVMNKVEERREI